MGIVKRKLPKNETDHFRQKSSSQSLANCEKLSRRNSGGAMPGNLVKGIDLKSKHLRKVGFSEHTIVGKCYTPDEIVFDTGIDRKTCENCDKSNCKVKRLSIPQKTLERFYDENFTCAKILDCIKANQNDYFESEKFLLQSKVLKIVIQNLENEISENQNILDGIKVYYKREKIESFESRKKTTFKRLSRQTFEVNQSILDVDKFVSEQKAKNGKSANVSKRRVIASKLVEIVSTIKTDDTMLFNAKFNLINLKIDLEKAKNQLKDVQTYKIPTLLTLDESKKVLEYVSTLKNQKKIKFASYRIFLTDNFLQNSIDITLNGIKQNARLESLESIIGLK